MPSSAIPARDPSPVTLGLVDPLWVGHHKTYFVSFIEAIVANGSRVLAVCPHPDDLKNLAEAHPDQVRVGPLEDPGRSRLFPRRESDPWTTHVRWFRAKQALTHLERQHGWKVDLVFFAWLDSYLRFMSSNAVARALMGVPWSGLYFRSQHLRHGGEGALKGRLRGDFLLRGQDCRAVASVDEEMIEILGQYSHKPAMAFPDITDETSGDPEHPLAREIRAKAAGRKVIGMIGLEKRKGFLTLLRAAQAAEREGHPWYFVFAGKLYWETLDEADVEWLRDLLKSPPGNIHLDPEAGPVPDGAAYNGVAGEFDIFFAAYVVSLFNSSSNTLTKAAFLRKPVIVSKGSCLEERAQRYDLGLSVPDSDPLACLQAIERLLEMRDWNGRALTPRFEDYYNRHSHQRLRQCMKELTGLAG